MKAWVVAIGCAIALLVGAAAPSAAQDVAGASVSSQHAASIDAVVRAQMAKRSIPGAQVVVVRNGRIIYSGSFGIADLETGTAVSPATVFTLNSSTKSFTGVAVMQLVAEGKLSLDAPASHYLDDLPTAWNTVTLRQLLTHISGLPDVIIQPKGQGTGTLVGDGGEESAWATVKTLPLQSPAGTQYRYNQTNYVLLGKIIDKVTGTPFARFMKDRQFDPAGMRATTFGDSRTIVPARARTYRYAGGAVDGDMRSRPLEHAFDDFTPFIRTAGGLNATAEDVGRWLAALQNDRLMAASARQTMWTPGRYNDGSATPWGLGWPLSDHGGHPVAAGIGGRRSAFFVYPRDDLAIVVLTNLAGANPEEFIDELAGQFLPDLLAVNGGGLPLPVKRLREALVRDGFATAPDAYARLRQRDKGFAIAEDDLNRWGGTMLGDGAIDEAVNIFALNTRLYPKSANAHDSLAEGYEAKGARDLAIASYRMSLALDPGNGHAIARLDALGAGVDQRK